MEGHAAPMVPSGGFNGPEHRSEGSNSNSTRTSSSRGDHGDGAYGTATAPKKRKARLSNWLDEQTQELLDACLQFKGRRHMRALPPKWQTISGSVNGKTAEECEGRMETLTKSFNRIKKYCAVHNMQFDQLSEQEFKDLVLPTKMKSKWYYQMCKIKEQRKITIMGVSICDPGDVRDLSSPAPEALMVCFFLYG